MKFFIDNNLSEHLAKGIKAFGEDVMHLKEKFPEDADDSDWLKYIGQNRIFLVTRDEKIRKIPAQLLAFKRYNVGAFFLGGKNRSRCQLIQQLVRNWPLMKDYATRKRRPFAFRVPPKGTKIVSIPLT